MKKRFLAGLMSLCMLLTLLPTAALGSGNVDWKEARVSSYEELVEALADPSNRYIYILPRQMNEYGEPTGAPFSWPAGDVTLDMDWEYTTQVSVSNGIWTIPENVTVNLYDNLYVAGHPYDEAMDGGILIQGQWNCMTRYATISCPTAGCASVTVDKEGILNISDDLWIQPAAVGEFIVNGTLINGGDLSIDDLTMGDGAKILERKDPNIKNSLRRVFLGGTITCAGTATIEGGLDVSDSTTQAITAVLDGNFILDRLTMDSDDSLVITEGSCVSVKDLWAIADRNGDNPVLYLNGRLVLEDEDSISHSLDGNTEVNIGSSGVLEIWSRSGLDSEDSTAKVTGNGVVKLFAAQRVWEDGWISWTDQASIFRCDGTEEDWPPQVADTVTIWRCWEDEDWCEHQWSTPVTVEPTCGAQGYTHCVCQVCGVEQHSSITPPLSQHTGLTAEPINDSCLRLNCSGCGISSVVSLHAYDVEYVEGQSAEGAFLEGAVEWLPEQPAILYTNNTSIGTAAATVTIMGITLTTNFEIVECLHEGGTATCSHQAVCTKCEKAYGETLPHVEKTPATCKEQAVCDVCGQSYGEVSDEHNWGDELFASATRHWASCEDCGEPMTSEEEMLIWMDERGLLPYWEECLEQYGNSSLIETYGFFGHIFTSESPSTCIFCGSGPLRTENAEAGKTQVDLILDALDAGKEIQIVAALYENGRMIGTEVLSVIVDEDGTVEESLEVQYGTQYSPDKCKVFVLDSNGSQPLMEALQSSID